MARPLRYEAAGAIYHVMARGDGGRQVFETDRDRLDALQRLEEVCGSYGWRIHAWVLMGNHFHLLLETPEPNLVKGMKWWLGVFSQGWNRRRKRRGHVFQGRYKSVVVNGEGSGMYFRIVADYIHLNPVRSGWVGGTTGKTLRSYRWSSFPQYLSKGRAGWLETSKVLGAFELEEGRRGAAAYGRYLESRARDREGALSDESLKELRRGWYFGDESFGKKVVAAVKGKLPKKRASVSGAVVRAHDEVEATKLLKQLLKELGLPQGRVALSGRGKWQREKALTCWVVRRHTGVSNAWLAERLSMGHVSSVTRALRRVRESKVLTKEAKRLERMLEI
ncbi:transposase [Haloferula sp.]|uniref:transposase n=1 Tax=Haloferula sp. TaxID=2497595 RepID=UPI00329F211A